MTIQINLDETPDSIPVVSTGIHTFEVLDIEEKEDKNGDSYQMVSMKVVEPGEEDDERRHWERFNFKYEIARVGFKKFVKACGHTATGEGLEPSELIGCTFKGRVTHKDDTDEDGEPIVRSNIKKYILEGVEV